MHSPSKYNLCSAAEIKSDVWWIMQRLSVWPHITLACDAWDAVSANVSLFNFFHFNSDFIADNMIRYDKERLTKTCVSPTAAVSRGEQMVMCRDILNKIIARFRWTMHSLYAII